MILLMDTEGPDQNMRMRMMIWDFTVHIRPKTRFRLAQP